MKKKMPDEMNEEKLKNCIIVPFLNSLGYNSEQLSFEDNFTLRLGKNIIKKKEYISGRLDILVMLNNEPFLIWELKRENLEITSEEINQAISYSRLTDKITPFTIISNGTKTCIYDTITKKEITKNELSFNSVDCDFDETIKLRMEALANIVCCSYENLKKFINKINNRELNRLYGNKYINELYVERQIVHNKFNEFIYNDRKLFFVTGNSGIGKTNIFCNLVETNMNDNLILFYNSCFIETSIINKIMDDFSFGFDEQLYGRQLLNRINLLAQKNKKNFILCIDAIDELAIKNPTIAVDKLLNLINEFSNFKVCLSCKKSYVHDYEEINGISTALKNISRDNIEISDFSDEEKNQIIDKYKKYFHVEIPNEQYSKLKEISKDGFLFRIIFETFENKKIDDNINNISLMQRYVEKVAINYGLNKNDLMKSLEIIGMIFINNRDDQFYPVIEEHIADNALRVNNVQIHVDTLIKCDILQLYKNNDANYIDFNFKPLSYYVITILSANLNLLNSKDFISKLFELNKNRRCKEALSWYSKNIKVNRYKEINEFKIQYGKKLISSYRKIVNYNFPNIKDKFEMNTDIDNVGIAIDNNYDCAIYTYSFYKKVNYNDDVKLVDFKNKAELIKLNIQTIHSSMVEININNIVKSRLKEIIKFKELNEEKCKNLNVENIIVNTFKYGKFLRLDYKYEVKNFIPNLNALIPLNLIDLRRKILVFNIKTLQQAGVISKEENVYDLYQKQINGIIDIPQCNYIYKGSSQVPIYSMANRITSYISIYSEETIEKPYLLLPKKIKENKKSSWVSDIMVESFSKEELYTYLKDILNKYIDEYILLIENNFPTLKNEMKYYNLFKKGVYLIFYFYKAKNSQFGHYSSKLWYCYSENNQKNIEIILCNEEDVPKDMDKMCMSIVSGKIDEYFFNGIDSTSENKYFVLSNLVYELVKSDLEDFISDNERKFIEI